MRDSFTGDNSHDFRQRYQGTFGWFLNKDKRIFVHLERVGDSIVQFSTGGSLDYSVNLDSEFEFEFIPVNHGWFTGSNGVPYYLSRVAARQWKRGISVDNTFMLCLRDDLVHTDITYRSLSNIFLNANEGKVYNFTPNKACSLSKHFALSSDNVLFFFNQVIGKYDDGNFVLNSPLVQQELTDLIRRQGMAVGVLINEDL